MRGSSFPALSSPALYRTVTDRIAPIAGICDSLWSGVTCHLAARGHLAVVPGGRFVAEKAMGLPTQDVKVRLLRRQADCFGEVVESRTYGPGFQQIQITAVFEGLPQSRVQAYGLGQKENRPIGPAFDREPYSAIQKSGWIRNGGETPSALNVEIRSEDQAEAG